LPSIHLELHIGHDQTYAYNPHEGQDYQDDYYGLDPSFLWYRLSHAITTNLLTSILAYNFEVIHVEIAIAPTYV